MGADRSPTPGRPRRQYRSSAERRKEIVEATLELLAAQGPRAWTTAALAERVGVSEATLFRHFPSKGDILVAAVTEHVDRTDAWIEAFEPDAPGWEGVRQLLEAFFARSVAAGGGPLVLLEQATRFPDDLRLRMRDSKLRAHVRLRGFLTGTPLEPVADQVTDIAVAVLSRSLLYWLAAEPGDPVPDPGASLELLGRAFEALADRPGGVAG